MGNIQITVQISGYFFTKIIKRLTFGKHVFLDELDKILFNHMRQNLFFFIRLIHLKHLQNTLQNGAIGIHAIGRFLYHRNQKVNDIPPQNFI